MSAKGYERWSRYHAAVTTDLEAASRAYSRGAWDEECERGRLRLVQLLSKGLTRYEPSELNYMGKASDGTWVLLGNPGPSVWRYLAKYPNPESW